MDERGGNGGCAPEADAVPREGSEVRALRFEGKGRVLAHPDLPVVLMPGALAPDAGAEAVAGLFRANGWGGTWRWRVFDFHHFHPGSHEVLAVACGRAELALGGPDGSRVRVVAGDVLVLPAGTGHRQVEADEAFEVVGAYPPGQEDVDTVRAEGPHERRTLARIAAVPKPLTDPVHGAHGPLLEAWAG